MNNPTEIVPSPTFTLVQEYQSPLGIIYHYDLYRLNAPEELYELNFEEAILTGLCLIEWAQIASPLLNNHPRINLILQKTSDLERSLTYELYR